MPASRRKAGLKEKDIVFLNCLALGLLYTDMAEVLGVSYTGILHRATYLREFSGAHNQAQLVYWALDRDQIPPLHTEGMGKVTARQLEVIELIAHGLEDRDIAKKLYLTYPSVRSHINRAMKSLGAFNRTNMVALAWSADLFV